MSLVDSLYAYLLNGPSPDCDEILEAALENAEDAWVERLERVLLERKNEPAWLALLRRRQKLPADIWREMCASEEPLCAAIALLAADTTAERRIDALRLCESLATPRLAYLLSEALRDPVPDVRAVAASGLRKTVDAFLVAEESAPENTQAERTEQRRQIVLAVVEALRTFELHHRVEAVEAALWLASDLPSDRWLALLSSRSRSAVVVREHVTQWNSPRLAGFLVRGLEKADWRPLLLRILNGWSTPAHFAALLRHVAGRDELDGLSILTVAPWLHVASAGLAEIPPALRCVAPRLLTALRLPVDQKITLLRTWIEHGQEPLQMAALEQLAKLNSAPCVAALKKFAALKSAVGKRARELLRATGPSDARGSAESFERLWSQAAAAMPGKRDALLNELRAGIEHWTHDLRDKLDAAAPTERLLALEVMSTRGLSTQFAQEIILLLTDFVPSIRRLAMVLIREVISQAQSGPTINSDLEDPQACLARLFAEKQLDRGDQRLVQLRQRIGELAGQTPAASRPEDSK